MKYWKDMVHSNFGVTLADDKGAWNAKNSAGVYFAMRRMDAKANGNIEAYSEGTTFYYQNTACEGSSYCGLASGTTITFSSTGSVPYQNIYHEFGHIMDFRTGNYFSNVLNANKVYTSDGTFVMGGVAGDSYNRNSYGYAADELLDPNWANKVSAQQHPTCDAATDWCTDGNTSSEEWADLWANFVVGNFITNPNASGYTYPNAYSYGIARQNWVSSFFFPTAPVTNDPFH